MLDTSDTSGLHAVGSGACSLLILQMTSFCNLDCNYCYLPNRSDKTRMSPEVLGVALGKLSGETVFAPEVLVNWHAGEPLTVGASYFEQMIGVFDQFPVGARFTHSVQTNATLIDEHYVDVFQKYNVAVGVSIDGPEDLNDKRRVGRNGKGSFRDTMNGVQYLRNAGMPFSTISVISSESISRIEEILHFLRDTGAATIAFNMEEIEGINGASTLSEITYEDAVNFWERLIGTAAKLNLAVREIDKTVLTLLGVSGYSANPNIRRDSYITIGTKGDVSAYSPELFGQKSREYNDFIFGNLLENTLADILNSALIMKLDEEVQRGVGKCRNECEYFAFCGGGCPSNKLGELGCFDGTETKMCRFMIKALVDAVLNTSKLETVGPYFKARIKSLGSSRKAPNSKPARRPAGRVTA